jgi:ubiquinone/menaquinone biosynthesis C-methylase UbiE
MKVLDVGCGVGGPARQIANFTDARITGLNNNDFQIARARKYTEKAGLSHLVDFKKGDFMKLSEQFGENAFDAGESLVSHQATNFPSTLIQCADRISSFLCLPRSLRHRGHLPRPDL